MFTQKHNQQQKQKSIVRKLLVNDYAYLLPEELWDLILTHLFRKEECVVHIVFEKLYFFHKDYYYIFSGTEKQLSASMSFLKNEINNDTEYVDTPIDTYCNSKCYTIGKACPDENGGKCGCSWIHIIFPTKNTLNHYLVNNLPSLSPHFSVVRDISNLH